MVGANGRFRLPGRQRYVIAFPNRTTAVGRVIDLERTEFDPMSIEIEWPRVPMDTVFGTITSQLPINVAGSILRLYEARTGIVAQTMVAMNSAGYELPLPSGSYRGRLSILDPDLGFAQQFDLGEIAVAGNRRWDIELRQIATAIGAPASSMPPRQAELLPSFPNPFNSTTLVPFHLPAEGRVRLEVFDILGQRVAILIDDLRAAGKHMATWDGQTDDGQRVSSGVYFCQFRSGSVRVTQKMLLLR